MNGNERHVLYHGGGAFNPDLSPVGGSFMQPGSLEFFWETATDAFREQFPSGTSEDLRRVTIMYSALIHVLTRVGDVRTEEPSSPVSIGFDYDPCFPPFIASKRLWKEAILFSEVTPDSVDHITRDLDDPSATFLPTLFDHIGQVVEGAYNRLDQEVGVLPQFAWEHAGVARTLDAKNLGWIREAGQLEIPSGLRTAYVQSLHTNSLLAGEAYPEYVENLTALWHACTTMAAGAGGGGITSISLMSYADVVMVTPTQDGAGLVVSLWHRECSFEEMVSFHEALGRVVDQMGLTSGWF